MQSRCCKGPSRCYRCPSRCYRPPRKCCSVGVAGASVGVAVGEDDSPPLYSSPPHPQEARRYKEIPLPRRQLEQCLRQMGSGHLEPVGEGKGLEARGRLPSVCCGMGGAPPVRALWGLEGGAPPVAPHTTCT